MNNFIKNFQNFTEKHHYHILHAVEIKDDIESEALFIPVHTAHDCYSVAKVFVVTAIGMLYDDGLLHPDDIITERLADLCPPNMDQAYRLLTIDHTLRHCLGLPAGYLDIDISHPDAFGTDFLTHILTTPPEYTPGTVSVYTDAAYYLLARLVEKISGLSLETFLWKRLFTPLGFREAAWSKCPEGHAMGATGLYLHTADMAKLGLLYLNHGMYNNTKILSEEWVDLVLSRGYELHSCCNHTAYAKRGMYGQMLMILPEQNRVIAWHACEPENMSALTEWICHYADS